jgi:hypothetical protein
MVKHKKYIHRSLFPLALELAHEKNKVALEARPYTKKP